MQPDVLLLVPVCSEHFAHKIINSEEGCIIQQFCTQNRLNPTAFNLFIAVEHLPKRMRDQPPRDVILMDKVFNGDIVHTLYACLTTVELLLLNNVEVKRVIYWS